MDDALAMLERARERLAKRVGVSGKRRDGCHPRVEARRKDGKAPRDAIFEACMIRFRPIMMTTMAALMGSLPIALAFGVAVLASALGALVPARRAGLHARGARGSVPP